MFFWQFFYELAINQQCSLCIQTPQNIQIQTLLKYIKQKQRDRTSKRQVMNSIMIVLKEKKKKTFILLFRVIQFCFCGMKRDLFSLEKHCWSRILCLFKRTFIGHVTVLTRKPRRTALRRVGLARACGSGNELSCPCCSIQPAEKVELLEFARDLSLKREVINVSIITHTVGYDCQSPLVV